MNENKEQVEFLQWLSTNVREFEDKTPEEIVNTLNELYQTPEGQEQVVNLIKSFKDSKKKASKFAKGGKLDYLVTKYQNGNPFKGKMNLKIKGKNPLNKDVETLEKGNKVHNPSKQRSSDANRREFYKVDLYKYGPWSRVNPVTNTSSGVVLKDGISQETLPNGVGLRQITRNNITTTELVSPDKKDTLYIHNGNSGRVDSNIDDSGFWGWLGLKESTPVTDRYKYLQRRFNNTDFNKK